MGQTNAKRVEFDGSDGWPDFVTTAREALAEARYNGGEFNTINAGMFLTSRIMSAINDTGGQVITSSPSTIIIDKASSESDILALRLSSGELEFLDGGKFNVFYSVAFDNSNGNRTNTQSFLEIDTGSGFSKLEGSDVFTYERTSNADRQTGTGVATIEVPANGRIRIRSQVIQGSNNSTVEKACKIQVSPFITADNDPIFDIDGSDLTQDEILGELDAGELE